MYKGSRKRLPRAVFIIGLFVIGIICFFIPIDNNKNASLEREASAIVCGMVVVSYIIYKVFKISFIKIRNTILHIDTYNDLDTMNRDINVKYSPAVLSYLYNQKLEPKKDILATILTLYNKKAIVIQKTSEEYKFLPSDSADIKNLSLTVDEEYIYNCFVINKEKFSIEIWNTIVKNEYKRCGFSRTNEEFRETQKKKESYIITILIIATIIVSAIIAWLFGDLMLADSLKNIPRIYTFIVQMLFLSLIAVFPVLIFIYSIRRYCT